MPTQYQVLARKWRPQQFADVVGQEHITTTLRNAIEQDRLAHAYLFVGPRGIGKTSTARIFAKALNCAKGPTITPCDKCDSCREIAAGNSLDVLEIDGASNRGIDEVRELRDTVRYAPARGKFKIYIIDEVHMLTKEAFNALLKTLEEPPAHVKFLFATTEPQKVLPTILSRCQRFDLRRIPANLIVRRLQEIAKDEKVKIDDAALSAIARGAEGGLRDAESALDQLIAFCGDTIAEADVLGVFGLVAHDRMAVLTDAIIDGRATEALQVLKELDDVGKDLQRLLADLLEHFRNLLVLTVAGDQGTGLDLPETPAALLRAQVTRIDADAVLRIIDALAGAEGRLRYALSKRIFLEIALVKAIKAREATGIETVIRKLAALKTQWERGAAGAAPEPGSPPPPGPARDAGPADKPAAAMVAESGPPAQLAAAWADAVEHLGKVNPLAKNYLVEARPLGLRGNVVVIGFDPEFASNREFVDRPRNIELLQGRLKEKLRREVSIRFEIAEAEDVDPAAAPAAARPAEAESTRPAAPARPTAARPPPPPPAAPSKKNLDEFRNDPLIKKALEVFKGQIVEVRK